MSTPEEQELAQVRAEIARARAACAEVKRAAAAKHALAAAKQQLVDDAKFAELEDKHGALARVNTKHGMVLVKEPEPILYRQFVDHAMRADNPNPKLRRSFHDTCEAMAKHCVVFPDRAAYDAIAEKVPGLAIVVANAAYELGKAEVEESEKE